MVFSAICFWHLKVKICLTYIENGILAEYKKFEDFKVVTRTLGRKRYLDMQNGVGGLQDFPFNWLKLFRSGVNTATRKGKCVNLLKMIVKHADQEANKLKKLKLITSRKANQQKNMVRCYPFCN